MRFAPFLLTKLASRATKMARFSNTVGTHSGTFQADEALGVWLLRRLPEYADAPLTRSRDPKVLAPLTLVLDVGAEYDHAKLRYDHHQRGFFETVDGAVGAATGPETATGAFKTKLSASGLVYKHYGRRILGLLKPALAGDEKALEWCYVKLYEAFMEALDAIDNGIEVAEGPLRYRDGSSLPGRVHRLNRPWNVPAADAKADEDARFEKASALCGEDFLGCLDYVADVEWPARALVARALASREAVDASGRVVVFESGGCPWKDHLYELEREAGIGPHVRFVLYTDSAGMWRIQAVTEEGTQFTNRLGLLEPWRGLRDAELDAKSGIPGGKFVHNSGFIGGHATKDGALAMARATLAAATADAREK